MIESWTLEQRRTIHCKISNATVRIPAVGFVNERQAMLDDFRSFGEEIIGKI